MKISPELRQLAREIRELRPDPDNARKHSERNVQAIARSLERYGQQKPIVIKADGTCIAGSGTLEAARRLGWTELAAVVSDLEGLDQTAYAIADNRTAELAEWDVGTLLEQVGELDITDVGFDFEEIEEMTREALAEDAREALRAAGKDKSARIYQQPVKAPPMGWVLVGLPMERFGELQELLRDCRELDGAIVEVMAGEDS